MAQWTQAIHHPSISANESNFCKEHIQMVFQKFLKLNDSLSTK